MSMEHTLCLDAAQEACRVNMADTAHALSQYRALTSLSLVQSLDPDFNNIAMMATLPTSLHDLTIYVFAPVKVLVQTPHDAAV